MSVLGTEVLVSPPEISGGFNEQHNIPSYLDEHYLEETSSSNHHLATVTFPPAHSRVSSNVMLGGDISSPTHHAPLNFGSSGTYQVKPTPARSANNNPVCPQSIGISPAHNLFGDQSLGFDLNRDDDGAYSEYKGSSPIYSPLRTKTSSKRKMVDMDMGIGSPSKRPRHQSMTVISNSGSAPPTPTRAGTLPGSSRGPIQRSASYAHGPVSTESRNFSGQSLTSSISTQIMSPTPIFDEGTGHIPPLTASMSAPAGISALSYHNSSSMPPSPAISSKHLDASAYDSSMAQPPLALGPTSRPPSAFDHNDTAAIDPTLQAVHPYSHGQHLTAGNIHPSEASNLPLPGIVSAPLSRTASMDTIRRTPPSVGQSMEGFDHPMEYPAPPPRSAIPVASAFDTVRMSPVNGHSIYAPAPHHAYGPPPPPTEGHYWHTHHTLPHPGHGVHGPSAQQSHHAYPHGSTPMSSQIAYPPPNTAAYPAYPAHHGPVHYHGHTPFQPGPAGPYAGPTAYAHAPQYHGQPPHIQAYHPRPKPPPRAYTAPGSTFPSAVMPTSDGTTGMFASSHSTSAPPVWSGQVPPAPMPESPSSLYTNVRPESHGDAAYEPAVPRRRTSGRGRPKVRRDEHAGSSMSYHSVPEAIPEEDMHASGGSNPDFFHAQPSATRSKHDVHDFGDYLPHPSELHHPDYNNQQQLQVQIQYPAGPTYAPALHLPPPMTHQPPVNGGAGLSKEFLDQLFKTTHMVQFEGGPVVKRFVCLIENCERDFPRRSAILSHVQTHLGDKRNVCTSPGCTASFVRCHDLKRHEKIHSGQKPFWCPCNKTFARGDALTRHKERNLCIGGIAKPEEH